MRKLLVFGRSGDSVWLKLAPLMAAAFLIYWGDAMMSFWVPGLLEESLGGGLWMGLVMAFSSVVGLSMDMLLPQIVRKVKVTNFYVMACLVGMGFALIMGLSSHWPLVLWFLVGMAVWGVYYELLLFANQQYVSETVTTEQRPGAWAMLHSVGSLAYVIGPVSAGVLLGLGVEKMIAAVIGLVVVGLFMVIVVVPKRREQEIEVKVHHMSLVVELTHWRDLMPRVWPILLMSLTIVLIDSAFWSVGAVFADKLAEESWWGGFWLSAYMLPSLVAGLLVTRWSIAKGKKRWAAKFLGFGGLTLSLLGGPIGLPLQVVAVFASGMFLALSIPLLDAVYTDLLVRMGRERKHLIGLTAAMGSFAYVIGPVLAGGLSDMLSERMVFVVMGLAAFVLSLVLLTLMPRKLKLPREKIEGWETAEKKK